MRWDIAALRSPTTSNKRSLAIASSLLLSLHPGWVWSQDLKLAAKFSSYFDQAPTNPVANDVVAQLMLNQAMLLFSEGNYEEAISQFKQLGEGDAAAAQYLAPIAL